MTDQQLTVKELQAAKELLQQTVAKALDRFSEHTGLTVETLDMERLDVFGGSSRYLISAAVQL